MKLIHTADWHLGNTFHGHSRDDEHRHFLDWLLGTLRMEQPDALLVTGDVFDSPNPSASAERLFYDFLTAAAQAVEGLQVVVTAGNHDSGGRLEAPARLMRAYNIYVCGTVCRTDGADPASQPDYGRHLLPLCRRDDPDREACLAVFAVPYLRSGDYAPGLTQQQGIAEFFDRMQRSLKASPFKGLPVVACAHLYAGGAEIAPDEHSERLVVGGQDRVDVGEVEGRVAYLALGHIHKAQQVSERTWYAGAPIAMSFAEKHYERGVLAVDIDDEGRAGVRRIGYAPLRRLISLPARGAASPDEAVALVAQLPRRDKHDNGDAWPYIEIRVSERQPEPGLLRAVTEELADKAVRFCRMVRVTDTPEPAAEGGGASFQTLQQLSATELAKRIFREQYQAEMPQEMLQRLESVAAPADSDNEEDTTD